MDIKSIVLYLTKKGLNNGEIHRELVKTLKFSAPAYSTVCKYARSSSWTQQEVKEDPEKKYMEQIITEAILSALDKQPFASVCEIAKLTRISKTTVHRFLTDVMHFKNKALKWVPHELTPAMQKNRVKLGIELHDKLIEVLNSKKHIVVTLDESWMLMTQFGFKRMKHLQQDQRGFLTKNAC